MARRRARTIATRVRSSLLLGAALLPGACSRNAPATSESNAGAGGSAVVTDAGEPLACVTPIVKANCALGACHDAETREHGMDLSNGTSIYDAWVGRNGLDHCRNALRTRVVPGDPDASYVMSKILGRLECESELSRRMPPPEFPSLLPEQIEALRAWIANGAPLHCDAYGGAATVGATGQGGFGGAGTSAAAASTTTGNGGSAAVNGNGGGGTGAAGGAANGGGGQDAGVDDYYTCTTEKACDPGLLCAGERCSEQPWSCVGHDVEPPLEHPCPEDYAEYCGCDGVTFEALLTCPDRPFAHPGACGDGYNCDSYDTLCDDEAPSCPVDEVPAVVDDCFGPCVPASSCRCEYSWECPAPYECGADRRCSPPIMDGGT